MWTRDPVPGEPVEDLTNQKIGLVVEFNHASDLLVIEDRKGNRWETPIDETAPYAVTEDW